jgi:hypothetical protein
MGYYTGKQPLNAVIAVVSASRAVGVSHPAAGDEGMLLPTNRTRAFIDRWVAKLTEAPPIGHHGQQGVSDLLRVGHQVVRDGDR